MSFVPISSAFMDADANKTINMIIYYARTYNILIPVLYENPFKVYSESKYVGAYVINPWVGLNKSSPVFAFDF